MKIEIVHSPQTIDHRGKLLKKLLAVFFTFHSLIFSFSCYSQTVVVGTNISVNIADLLVMSGGEYINHKLGGISNPGTITGSAAVCLNASGIPYSVALVPGATIYNWSVPSGATITTGQGSAAITVNFGTVGGNVCVMATNA